VKKNYMRCCLVCAVAFTLCGCASYYKVTDPASGRAYYTDHIENKGSGAVRFKDENSKVFVVLSTSEVMEITEDQYKANIHPK
jgi:hypothetical protein